MLIMRRYLSFVMQSCQGWAFFFEVLNKDETSCLFCSVRSCGFWCLKKGKKPPYRKQHFLLAAAPKQNSGCLVSGIEVAQKQKILSQCLCIWVYKRGFCFLGPVERDQRKLHHSVFDLALNVFIFVFNSSLTLLPSMASSLTLLKSISQKMPSNPKQIRQDNNELQQHLKYQPKNARAGWQLLLLRFWHFTCWETQLTKLTWFCSSF